MQAYSDPERETDLYALPDLEVWEDTLYESACCEVTHPGSHVRACKGQPCLSCGKPANFYPLREAQKNDKGGPGTILKGWFYWFCFPGCLPEGEPNGPFDSEEDALEDARSF